MPYFVSWSRVLSSIAMRIKANTTLMITSHCIIIHLIFTSFEVEKVDNLESFGTRRLAAAAKLVASAGLVV